MTKDVGKTDNTERAALHLKQMSTKVRSKLRAASKKSKLPQWFIVEKILEDNLRVRKNFDAKKWLKSF